MERVGGIGGFFFRAEVEVDPEDQPMGRFASLPDPEGNIVQLWEPGGGAK